MAQRTAVLLTLLVLTALCLRSPVRLWVRDNWEYFLWLADLWKSPKYTNSSPLDTTSPWLSAQFVQSKPLCEWNCSWHSTLSNAEYLATYPTEPTFRLNDTETVYPLPHPLACLPSNFGYSESSGKATFPYYGYPRCSEIAHTSGSISLNITSNELHFTCPGNSSSRIVLGPIDERKLVLRREVEDWWEVQNSPKSPLQVQPFHEFAFGTCDSHSPFLDLATYILRPNQTAYEETLKTMKTLQFTRKKPLLVMLLVIDSYSRKHFYRKMPKTANYLNLLNQNQQYRVFDFKLHNIMGGNSVANQMPILAAKPTIDDFSPNRDFTGNSSLWSVFKSKGFMTYFGFEDCDDSFPRRIGRMPAVDHSTNPFYCAVYKFTDCRMSKSSQKQRCIGPHMSHHYILNYTQQFSRAYWHANQWLYVHLSAAHEASGQHAETLDEDLTDYLRTYLEDFGSTHEVLILLEADHGMRYGDWYRHLEAFQENRLPVLFLIGSQSLLEAIPGSFDTLKHNTYRLNSKLDMRKMMIYMANWPYKQPFQSDYLEGVNLITEKIRDNRTCEEAKIPPWHCSCLELKEINLAEIEHSELKIALNLLALHAISLFNEEVYSVKSSFKGNLCVKLHLNRIEAAYGVRLTAMSEELKLELSVSESSSFRIEVTFLLTSNHKQGKDANQPFLPLLYNGYRKAARLLTSMRLDRYVGPCEAAARARDLNPEYCVCGAD